MNKIVAMVTMAYVAAFVAHGSAFAQQKDMYGNIITPEVAKYKAEEARRKSVEDAIRNGKAISGMTESEVNRALGSPIRITDNGGRVQWVYEQGNKNTYVYFVNGRVR